MLFSVNFIIGVLSLKWFYEHILIVLRKRVFLFYNKYCNYTTIISGTDTELFFNWFKMYLNIFTLLNFYFRYHKCLKNYPSEPLR